MNRHKRCPVCNLNHRPGNCKNLREVTRSDRGEGTHTIPLLGPGDRSERLGSRSIGILASDLTRLLGNRGVAVYKDPFSVRAEEITRRAIERADTHGMEHYGAAPEPVDEKRDLYQEAIEELLDAIYYLTRQVARIEDLRERLARGE